MTPHYAIYKTKFIKGDELTLQNQGVDADKSLEEAREIFSRLFKDHDLKIFRTKNDGTANVYPNYVWHWDEDVFLIRLSNRQLMKLVQLQDDPAGGAPKCVESKIESNPYCYVIIDNRPGRCQVAIEQSSAWKNDPDVVRDVLQETFNFRMIDDKLKVCFHAKMQTTKIWEFCRHRVYDLKDPITKLALEIDNPDRIKQYNAPETMGDSVQAMMNMVRNSKAIRALFTLYADQNSPMAMDEKIEDMAQIVSVCSSNAYHLTIYFKKLRAYRCDEKVKALFPIHKGDIESFQQAVRVLSENNEIGEYALIQWLDYVFEETKNFEDAAQVHKPRNNRRKK